MLAAILTPLGVNGENIRKVGEIENSFSCKPQCILLSAATRQRGGRQATFPVPQSQEKKSGGNFSTWGGGTEKMGKSREIRVECKNFPGENERVTWPQRKLLSSYPHPKKIRPLSPAGLHDKMFPPITGERSRKIRVRIASRKRVRASEHGLPPHNYFTFHSEPGVCLSGRGGNDSSNRSVCQLSAKNRSSPSPTFFCL